MLSVTPVPPVGPSPLLPYLIIIIEITNLISVTGRSRSDGSEWVTEWLSESELADLTRKSSQAAGTGGSSPWPKLSPVNSFHFSTKNCAWPDWPNMFLPDEEKSKTSSSNKHQLKVVRFRLEKWFKLWTLYHGSVVPLAMFFLRIKKGNN